MAVYLIANVKVIDDAWLADYATNVHEIVHKHGGKYLARSGNIMTIEGAEPDVNVIALLEFPSIESVHAFSNDPEYAKYREIRQAGSVGSFHVIDDSDVAASIPYLPNGLE